MSYLSLSIFLLATLLLSLKKAIIIWHELFDENSVSENVKPIRIIDSVRNKTEILKVLSQ